MSEKLEKVGSYLQKIAMKAHWAESGDAGALVTDDVLQDILKPNYMAGTIYERCQIFNIDDKHNGIKIPIANETSRTTAGILGGLAAANVQEGDAITPDNPTFSVLTLTPDNRIAITIPVTEELLTDAPNLGIYVSRAIQEAVRWKIDRDILYGNANSANGESLHGIVGSGKRATHFVSVADPIVAANVRSMVYDYYGGKQGIWVMAHDMYHQIIDLYANTFALRYDNDGNAWLYGYRIYTMDNIDTKQIVLGDFSQYAIAQKEPRSDISAHVYWLTAQTAFRFYIRITGMPIWVSGITEQSGDVNYPFIANAVMEYSSSSSSSSNSSSSSSSSMSSESSSSKSSESSSSSSSSPWSQSSASSKSSSSSGAEIDVRGTLSPNATGLYATDGTYNGQALYRRIDGSYYVWYDTGSTTWRISVQPNVVVPQWIGGATITATTYAANNGSTGVATVSTT